MAAGTPPTPVDLSRYVRVPRELSSLPLLPFFEDITLPLILRARVQISGISRHRRISYPPCRMSCGLPSTTAPGRDNAALFVQGVRHLLVYGVNVYSKDQHSVSVIFHAARRAYGLTCNIEAKTHIPRPVQEFPCTRVQD